MSDSPCHIRNYRPDDFDDYVQLHMEAEKLDATGRGTSPQALGERLSRPNYVPGEDLFVAEVAGKVIGYTDITPELRIGRVVLDCLVHPEHRRKGLATRLFHYAMRRTAELGAKVAHVNVPQDNVAAQSLLSKLGFRSVRRFLELRLEISQAHLPDVEQSALPSCHLQHGEEDKLTEIQNRSFADTWGYNPNTREGIIYRLNLSHCPPEDVILTPDGDKPIAYCWTRIKEETTDRGTNKGHIYMLGVAPEYRGKGIGKQMLLAGLSYLKSKDIEVIELTVDSENIAACALYHSVGFWVWSTSLWYEKAPD